MSCVWRGAVPYSGVLCLMGEALYLVVGVLYLLVGVLYLVVGVLYPRRARRCFRTRAGSSFLVLTVFIEETH